jgi:SpoIID/LytB domain protein
MLLSVKLMGDVLKIQQKTRSPLVARRFRWYGTSLVVTLLSVTVGWGEPGLAQTTTMNPILDIGVVQRFGSTADDELVLEPLSGDRLTLHFKTGDQEQTVTTNQVTIDVVMQPVAEPQVTERVVLSTHRSFESAEDSANQWRSRGIEVEIAQPDQWQVWAKRETYSTPLLRRLLYQNLQANGFSTAFLDTKTQTQIPAASFVVNGYRYTRDEVEITSANSRIRVESNLDDTVRLYGGEMRLQPNAYGTYTLVNEVPLETYLRGVVPHEIGLGAPPTTIEAQAILARTYVLRNLRRFEIDDYELCADTQCQVYWGLGDASPISDRAIANTQGMVLTYDDELVDALYSSTTGGVTAPFSDVWNGPDRSYLQAVVDSTQNVWDLSQRDLSNEANFRAFISQDEGFNEVGWDLFRWREESSMAEIADDVRDYLRSQQHPFANFTRIDKLEILERSPAGRVQRMAVYTDLGVVELDKDEVLRAIWAPNSTLFYLDPIYADENGNRSSGTASTSTTTRPLWGYAFVGGGFGHGVGMSQTGAYHLGDLGWSSERILTFYYPGTIVQPLNENIVFWRDPYESTENTNAALTDDSEF